MTRCSLRRLGFNVAAAAIGRLIYLTWGSLWETVIYTCSLIGLAYAAITDHDY